MTGLGRARDPAPMGHPQRHVRLAKRPVHEAVVVGVAAKTCGKVVDVGSFEQSEDLCVSSRDATSSEVGERKIRRPVVRDVTAAGEEQDPVDETQALSCMRDHDNDAPSISELAQNRHDLMFVAGIEPRRGLVEEQQRRLGEKLDRETRPLPLTARKLVDPQICTLSQSQLVDDMVDPGCATNLSEVRRQAQRSRRLELLADRQLGMNEIVLWHVADSRTELVISGIKVPPCKPDPTFRRRAEPVECTEECCLTGPRRADDRKHAPRR